MDLEKLRLKTSEELNDDERKFIKENVDKLTDEDKEAYKDFLVAKNDDDDNNDDDNGDDDNNDDKGDDDKGSDDDKTKGGYTFKTEEDAKSFVAGILKEQNEKAKQAAIDAAKTPAEKKYVEENWKPKNWNEGLKKIVDVVKEEIKSDQKKNSEEADERKKAFQKEWDGIVTSNKLPARGTDEGDKLLKKVYDIGIKYNQPNFTKAYELWKIVPKSAGGGADIGVDETKKTDLKKAAAKIAGKTPDGDKPTLKPKSYQELHNKTISQLTRDAVKAGA